MPPPASRMPISYLSRIEAGKILKGLRVGKSQTQVARLLDYAPVVISQIETGRAAVPFKDVGRFVKAYCGEFNLQAHHDIIQLLWPGAWEMIGEIAQELTSGRHD